MRYILGDGGLARELFSYWAQEKVNIFEDDRIHGFIGLKDGEMCGLPVWSEESIPWGSVILGLGDVGLRRKLIEKYSNKYKFADLLYGFRSHLAITGRGLVMCPQSMITANATIGDFCLLNNQSCVTHDCVLGTNCVLSPGVLLGGGVMVGDNVFFGLGAIVLPNILICSDTIIGAGCVVTKSITTPGTYVGSPARLV